MKVVCKPIEMIAWFENDGKIHPIRFRLFKDNQYQVVNIDRVRCVKLEKLAGNQMHVFECESLFNGVLKIYELKYEIKSCQWILFKI